MKFQGGEEFDKKCYALRAYVDSLFVLKDEWLPHKSIPYDMSQHDQANLLREQLHEINKIINYLLFDLVDK